jgi:carbonic anhydrase
MSEIKVNAEFDYRLVKKGDVMIVYHLNILRFIPKHKGINMGKLTDVDATEYGVSEVLLHTPGEHTVMGREFDAELQVIHKAIKGVFK